MRLAFLRAAYALAMVATIIAGLNFPQVIRMLGMDKLGGSDAAPFMMAAIVAGWTAFVAILCASGFLCWRPYWWGKVITIWAGVSWLGFANNAHLLYAAKAVAAGAIGVAGGAMLLSAAVAQCADPSWGKSYLGSKNRPA